MYPDTSGVYDCDVKKLTCIQIQVVPMIVTSTTDLYPQVTFIHMQVGSHEQSRCTQTFNRGCFKMRDILKFLQKCSKQESKHLVISISDCIFEQDAVSVTVFVSNMQAMSMTLNVSEEEKDFLVIS